MYHGDMTLNFMSVLDKTKETELFKAEHFCLVIVVLVTGTGIGKLYSLVYCLVVLVSRGSSISVQYSQV